MSEYASVCIWKAAKKTKVFRGRGNILLILYDFLQKKMGPRGYNPLRGTWRAYPAHWGPFKRPRGPNPRARTRQNEEGRGRGGKEGIGEREATGRRSRRKRRKKERKKGSPETHWWGLGVHPGHARAERGRASERANERGGGGSEQWGEGGMLYASHSLRVRPRSSKRSCHATRAPFRNRKAPGQSGEGAPI